MKWDKEKLQLLEKIYPIKSNDELCIIFGVKNKRSIAELARRNGFKKQIDPSRKGTLKPLLEENNIVYYWLGFIMADGYISDKGQLVVALSNKDEKHLEKLATLLKTNIRNYPSSNKKGTQSRISVQDKKDGILLRNKLKIETKKTYDAPKLDNIPEQFLLSFIIGFIDGDGCLVNKNIKIECHKNWEENFNYIGKFLKEKFNIDFKINISKEKYVSITFNVKDSKIIKNNMLKLNIPFLERKWDIIINQN